MKALKKSLCLILSIVMMFSCFALSSEAITIDGEEIDHLPQVYVSGYESLSVHYKDDPNKTALFPVNFDLLVENAKRVGDYTADSIKNMELDLLYNYIYSLLYDSLGVYALQPDGLTSVDENVVCDELVFRHSGDGVYTFSYDCRLSPLDLADQLHEFIKKVQEHSGSERFELIGASYGTTVVMTYLNEHPEMHKNIDSLLLSVPSYGGFSVVGELFSGDFYIDHDTLTQYAYVGLNMEELGLFLSVLNKSGVLEILLECLLIPGAKAIALEAVLDVVRDALGTIPSFWTFVQEEYFYDAIENIYGENYADPNHEYAPLIDKVTYYQEQVQQRLDEIYRDALDSGIKMNIICKYGRPPMPLSEKGSFMSDGAVAVSDVTMGATASKYDETLPEGYKQALYPEYNFISPDNCIDASTGIDPLHTWYVKGLEHTLKNRGFNELIDYILYEDPDVFSGDKFPQFTKAADDGSLVPVTGPDEKEETTLLQDLLKLVICLVKLIYGFVSDLIGKYSA